MESAHSHRKDEHLALAEAQQRQTTLVSSLDQVRIIPNGLPESSVAKVNLTSPDSKFPFETPFYIEAMTGGSRKTGSINEKLALAARETNIAMAVGSQSIALKDPSVAETFTIARKTNPTGFLIANIGAGHNLTDAQAAIDMIDANALEVHINVAQEIVMPEGDRDFIWQAELAEIIQKVSVPVIIKEVGFGMSQQTIQTLADLGAQYINLGGRSGTNFARIEDRRNRELEAEHAYLYDWGLTTAESLLEAQKIVQRPTIFATGGIQSPLDVLKAQILGARAVGVAGHFLHTILTTDTAGLISEIERWQNHLAKLYALTGAEDYSDLANVEYVLSSELLNFAQQR